MLKGAKSEVPPVTQEGNKNWIRNEVLLNVEVILNEANQHMVY